MHCRALTDGHGRVIGFVCGRARSTTCSICKRARATKQCDFKLDGGRTCDRHLCGRCAMQQRVGTDGDSVDFCPAHDRMFRDQNLQLTEGKRDDRGAQVTARGPWFVTARAVREYLELTGREATEQTFPDGKDELLEIAADESSRHLVRLQDNGQELWRLRGKPRLRLLVAPGPRPEGPLPQLVRVLPEHASQGKRH